jgi:hypothetical protein
MDGGLKGRVEAALAALEERYPEVGGTVRLSVGNYGREILAFAGYLSVTLNAELWVPETLARYEAEWDGLVVDATVEGVIVHEFGHVLFRSAERALGFDEANRLAMAHAGTEGWFGPICVTRSGSVFGQENVSECIAESFSAFHRGRAAAGTFSGEALGNARAFWEDLLARMSAAPAASDGLPAPGA